MCANENRRVQCNYLVLERKKHKLISVFYSFLFWYETIALYHFTFCCSSCCCYFVSFINSFGPFACWNSYSLIFEKLSGFSYTVKTTANDCIDEWGDAVGENKVHKNVTSVKGRAKNKTEVVLKLFDFSFIINNIYHSIIV